MASPLSIAAGLVLVLADAIAPAKAVDLDPFTPDDFCRIKFLPGNAEGMKAGRIETAGIRFTENGITYFGVRGARFRATSVEVLNSACDVLPDEGTP